MRANFNSNCEKQKNTAGFSLPELLIVMVILGILTAISVPYLFQSRKLYRTEDQTIKIIDLMREAQQLAITRRRTFRFEIDKTANSVLTIDEKEAGAADDTQVKEIPLEAVHEVRYDVLPTGVSKPNPPNYNDPVFATDTIGHKVNNTTVTGNNVWAIRFKRDGTVVNAAGDMISTNLYLFPPQTSGSTTPRKLSDVRAVTIFGGSGAIRLWKHNGTSFVAYN